VGTRPHQNMPHEPPIYPRSGPGRQGSNAPANGPLTSDKSSSTAAAIPQTFFPSITGDKMRNTLIFAGTSCPALTSKICENLGMAPADAELTQFSNVRFPFSFLQPLLRGRSPETLVLRAVGGKPIG